MNESYVVRWVFQNAEHITDECNDTLQDGTLVLRVNGNDGNAFKEIGHDNLRMIAIMSESEYKSACCYTN